jgi:hypothetical protein
LRPAWTAYGGWVCPFPPLHFFLFLLSPTLPSFLIGFFFFFFLQYWLLNLLGKCSITWARPSILFLSVFQMGSCTLAQLASNRAPLISASQVAGIIGVHQHHNYFLVCWGTSILFSVMAILIYIPINKCIRISFPLHFYQYFIF